MTLSNIEKKLLMLAMDSAATEFEMAVAATKFISALKSRFPSGVELIKAIESGIGAAMPGERVYASQAEAQAAANAMNQGGWGDILRKAQQFGSARAARQQQYQQYQQESWEEFKRRMREQGIV